MKQLVKSYEIQAKRVKVFEALTEPLYIKQWSGDEAVMDPRSGGLFSLWSGSIHGENSEVSADRIVQKWKEKDWDNYSEVVFILNEKNGVTHLRMVHTLIPNSAFDALDEGWDRYFLGPLKSFLES